MVTGQEKLSKEERISIDQYVVFLSYTCNYLEILSYYLHLKLSIKIAINVSHILQV